MSDSERKVIPVKTEIKEELENMDEEEIDMEDSYWRKYSMDIDPLSGAEYSPYTMVKTEMGNEREHGDIREHRQTDLTFTASTTATGKIGTDDIECGTSTSNINWKGAHNIRNNSEILVKPEISTVRQTENESDNSDELISDSEYLSFINIKSHFMANEETNIDSKPEYEKDELEVGEETNLDTDSKSSNISHEENPLQIKTVELNSELLLKYPLPREDNTNNQLNKQHEIKQTYKCNQCVRTFAREDVLMMHKRIHSGENPYQCDICNKLFTKSTNLLSHRRIHTGEKPYKCEICTKSFTDKGKLVQHIRIHTGEKPYKCDLCFKSFAVKCTLIAHRRIHTGEKPFTCDVCNKSFTESCNLTSHKRIHTGEKPYKCELCTKSFTESSKLIIHRRIHTGEKPYKCDQCDKSFTVKSTLNTHRRIHTGEKPYKCDLCDKSFTVNSNLIYHKRSHTGEKPYKCDLCDKSFTINSNLLYHKRTHGIEEPHKCDN